MSATALTYVENYMDCVESLPDDMQRSVSQMLEIDLLYQDKLKDIERLLNSFCKEKDSTTRKRSLFNIKRCLCKTQELGDEKLQIVSQMVDMVDNKSRHIEMDMENLDTLRNDDMPSLFLKQADISQDISEEHHNILKPMEHHPKGNKRNRRPRQPDKPDPADTASPEKNNTDVEKKSDTTKKTTKKKVKSRKKAKTSSPVTEEIPIDPNEPTYCHCKQVSFGEMIGCDNDDCPIEWFHFSCVGLSTKPKGKWYCMNCQAERKKERNSR